MELIILDCPQIMQPISVLEHIYECYKILAQAKTFICAISCVCGLCTLLYKV